MAPLQLPLLVLQLLQLHQQQQQVLVDNCKVIIYIHRDYNTNTFYYGYHSVTTAASANAKQQHVHGMLALKIISCKHVGMF